MEIRDILRDGPRDEHDIWNEIEWYKFEDCYHKDGDDSEYTTYYVCGFVMKNGKWGILRHCDDESDGAILFPLRRDACEEMRTGYTRGYR